MSKDEEYFRLIIVGLLCHTEEAEDFFDGPMARSMDRNAMIEELMFGSLRPAESVVILDIDYARIYGVAEKIAKGLEFAVEGVAYPVDQQFEVEFAEVEGRCACDEYGPDFTYQRPDDSPNGWEFSLFSSVRFVVLPNSNANCFLIR